MTHTNNSTMHIPQVLDTCLLTILAVVTGGGGIVLTDMSVSNAAQSAELKLFLLPLIGSVFAFAMMIMLNPKPEDRKKIIGRSMFGLFLGVFVPQVVGIVHPNIESLMGKPAVLALVGWSVCMIGYAVAVPFTGGLFLRSGDLANKGLDYLEKKVPHEPSKAPPKTET